MPTEIAATVVAISRVEARKNHWHDVVAAAALAHASACFLVDRRDAGVSVLPLVGGRKPLFGILVAMAC